MRSYLSYLFIQLSKMYCSPTMGVKSGEKRGLTSPHALCYPQKYIQTKQQRLRREEYPAQSGTESPPAAEKGARGAEENMVSELRTEPGHRLGCDGSARYGGRVWEETSAPAEAARREAPAK